MSENGFAVRGWLHCLKEGSETIDVIEVIMNQFIERSAQRGYSEGVMDEMRRAHISTQRDEKDVPRDVKEEGVQTDQLKRWSAYKRGVLE